MTNACELVYQYRLLLGKCQTGQGLTVAEIETVERIEQLFRRDDHSRTDTYPRGCRRKFTRVGLDIVARLRNARLCDHVLVANISPGGMVCRGAPYVEVGDALEVRIDDAELAISYRSHARVSWLIDDVDDYDIGLQLLGTPVLIRHGRRSSCVKTRTPRAAAA